MRENAWKENLRDLYENDSDVSKRRTETNPIDIGVPPKKWWKESNKCGNIANKGEDADTDGLSGDILNLDLEWLCDLLNASLLYSWKNALIVPYTKEKIGEWTQKLQGISWLGVPEKSGKILLERIWEVTLGKIWEVLRRTDLCWAVDVQIKCLFFNRPMRNTWMSQVYCTFADLEKVYDELNKLELLKHRIKRLNLNVKKTV